MAATMWLLMIAGAASIFAAGGFGLVAIRLRRDDD
jgi:hypothetical protein